MGDDVFWPEDVKVGKCTLLALGATGGSLLLYKVFFEQKINMMFGVEMAGLQAQQRLYLPLRLLNSRKGEAQLQAP